ncbi:EamA-like transporter family [Pyrobaculum oguniense TE7]|mgnify:CR=1 FL=1|uniref:EamA-like transporter family n=1 Tax=Pyrobaculum oguniense (strain DSM 13380 / JCM 10595 / TE7) TaxID=698757 RepID=H6QAJ7_PYROT|nr:EamA-like transporter family [Pyrobaculum oguniense TE7]
MLGLLLALFSVTAWSTNYVAGRYLALHGVDPIALSLARFAVATPVIFAMTRFPRYAGGMRELALSSALGVSVFNIALYAALGYMSASAASLFVVMASPLTVVISYAARREAPPPTAVVGSLLALAGAYLVLAPYISIKSALGPALASVATLSWTAYTLYVRRLYKIYPPGPASAWISLMGLAFLAPTAVVAHFNTLAGWDVATALLYVAVVPGALAYTAWNVAISRAGPAKTAATLPLLPVITLAISAIILGEVPTIMQTVGITTAALGVFLTVRYAH